MVQLFRWIFPQHSRKYHIIFLAFVWLLGLYCGITLFHVSQISPFSLMHRVENYSVSIVSLLSVSLLPFLFSAFAVYTHSYAFLALLCFIKGCLFAFVSMGMFLAYDSAGWLIRLLVMFSDVCALVPLWCCWIQIAKGSFFESFRSVYISSFAVIFLVCLDFYLVSPLLMKLLEI